MDTFIYNGTHAESHERTVFNYNSDLSGDVEIDCDGATIHVPGEALFAFIAEYVRRERIAAIENASDDKVLGL